MLGYKATYIYVKDFIAITVEYRLSDDSTQYNCHGRTDPTYYMLF